MLSFNRLWTIFKLVDSLRIFNKFIGMLFQYAAPLYEKLFFKKFVFGLGWNSFKLLLRSS
jgi:hypothetical protein